MLTPSGALGVSAPPVTGGTRYSGQAGALLRAPGDFPAFLSGPTDPALAGNSLFPQDSEPAGLRASPADRMETHFAVT